MKPEEARIGMWVSVSLTGQIVEISGDRLILHHPKVYVSIPVESAEILSQTETLGND